MSVDTGHLRQLNVPLLHAREEDRRQSAYDVQDGLGQLKLASEPEKWLSGDGDRNGGGLRNSGRPR